MYLNLIHLNYKFEWQWVQIALQEFPHNDNNCNLVRLWAVNYILYVYVCMCISMCAPVGVSVIKEQQPDARSRNNNNNRRFFPKHRYKQTRIHTRMHVVCIPLDSYTVHLNQYLFTPLSALHAGRQRQREKFSKRMLQLCKMILGLQIHYAGGRTIRKISEYYE